jgi:hypothetical protein
VRIFLGEFFVALLPRNFDAHYEDDVRKCGRIFRLMNNPIHLLTFVAAIGAGLVAGIFFAFSNFGSGKIVPVRNKAIEVLRRQAHGGWKLIMGDPNARE